MSSSKPTPPPPTSTADVVGGGEEESRLELELQRRGVQASSSSLLSFASLETIEQTIEWWDAQAGAGPGVLVEAIRKGGVIEHPKRRERQFTRSEIDVMAARVGRPFTEHERELIAERRAR